jgi:hypothetical protein
MSSTQNQHDSITLDDNDVAGTTSQSPHMKGGRDS